MVTLIPLLFGAAQAQEPILPKNERVELAIHADVTADALGSTNDIISTFVPPFLDLDQQLDGIANVEGELFDIGFIGADYDFGIENIVVVPELRNALITPREPPVCRERISGDPFYDNGYLDVDIDADISLSPSWYTDFPSYGQPAVASASVSATLLGFITFDLASFSCDIRMDRVPAKADVDIFIGTTDNPNVFCPWEGKAGDITYPYDCYALDVDVRQFTWSFGNTPEGIALGIDDLGLDCGAFLNFILDVADLFGLDPIELLIETALPDVDNEIQTVLDDLETQITTVIDDTFPPEDGYALVQELDLLGTPIGIEICPRDLFVDDRGLRFESAGDIVLPELPHPCIAEYDKGGSRRSVPPAPPKYSDIGSYGVPSFTPNNPPQVAAGLDDDFGNKLLYGVWYTGVLCQQIDGANAPFEIPAGLSLDTSLFGLLSGGAFDDLLPDPQPLLIVTRPEGPPTFEVTDGANVAAARIEDMGLDFYADLDGRKVRLAGMNLDADIGVGVTFDSQTGVLAATIDLDPAAVGIDVVFNDLKPEASTSIEDGFSSILETVADPLLASLVDGFEFPLPAFAGIGVQSAFLAPSGVGPDRGAGGLTYRDFLGIFGSVGPVDYGDDTLEGCASGGATSCDTGCSTSSLPARLPMLLLPVLVALVRRRRD